jgi:hypothetical protein
MDDQPEPLQIRKSEGQGASVLDPTTGGHTSRPVQLTGLYIALLWSGASGGPG